MSKANDDNASDLQIKNLHQHLPVVNLYQCCDIVTWVTGRVFSF